MILSCVATSNRCGTSRNRALLQVCGWALTLLLGLCPMLSTSLSASARSAWDGWQTASIIPPGGVSTLRMAVEPNGIRVSFGRVVLDRLEARLEIDPTDGVGMLARVGIVEFVPLDIVAQLSWASPFALASTWRLGPFAISLGREITVEGTAWIESMWAVSDRLSVGGGWSQTRTIGQEVRRSWIIRLEALAPSRWVGWNLWISSGGGGISWYRSWAG